MTCRHGYTERHWLPDDEFGKVRDKDGFVTNYCDPPGPRSSAPTRCAFCGYPDHRHRIVDAIWERIAAGEDPETVLADYVGTDDPYKWLAGLSLAVYTRVVAYTDHGEKT